MSTTANPYGLSRLEYKGGKDKGSTSTYYISSGFATSLGQGDPVNVGVNGFVGAYTAPSTTSTTVQMQTVGTFVKVSYTDIYGNSQEDPYWAAGTATFNGQPAEVTIDDVPWVVYKVQANASLGLTTPNTAMFKNYNLILNTPSSATSQSTAALNVSSYGASTTALGTLRIIGLATSGPSGSSNSWYDTYPDLLVVINNSIFHTPVAGL